MSVNPPANGAVQQSKRHSATIQTAQCNDPNGTVQRSKRHSATIQTAQCNNLFARFYVHWNVAGNHNGSDWRGVL